MTGHLPLLTVLRYGHEEGTTLIRSPGSKGTAGGWLWLLPLALAVGIRKILKPQFTRLFSFSNVCLHVFQLNKRLRI